MRLLHVVGTRPNLVKMAPVIAAARERFPDWPSTVVHTGQHYDREMSEVFLSELGIGKPDHALGVGSGTHAEQTARVIDRLGPGIGKPDHAVGVGSGTHAEQTARVIERLEPVLVAERPDLVVVPGDVNSTLAAALTAGKMEIPVAHVEAGLRSFDLTMPEEINRIVADRFASHLFLHSEEAAENLRAEGIPAERQHLVGNTMIDTLVALEDRFRAAAAAGALGLAPGEYLLVTLYRP